MNARLSEIAHAAFMLLSACAVVALCACFSETEPAYAKYNDASTSYPASQDLGSYGDAISGSEIPDGVYEVTVASSSRMCVLYSDSDLSQGYSALIQVSGGSIIAVFYTSGAYTRLYYGTAEAAAALAKDDGSEVDGAYIAGDPLEGYSPHAFAMAIPALNTELTIATYNGGQSVANGKWYTRTFVFKPTEEVTKAIAEKKQGDDSGSSGGDDQENGDDGDESGSKENPGDSSGSENAGSNSAGSENSQNGSDASDGKKGESAAGGKSAASEGNEKSSGSAGSADDSSEGASSTGATAAAAGGDSSDSDESDEDGEGTEQDGDAASEGTTEGRESVTAVRGVLISPASAEMPQIDLSEVQPLNAVVEQQGVTVAQVIAVMTLVLFLVGAAWRVVTHAVARRFVPKRVEGQNAHSALKQWFRRIAGLA